MTENFEDNKQNMTAFVNEFEFVSENLELEDERNSQIAYIGNKVILSLEENQILIENENPNDFNDDINSHIIKLEETKKIDETKKSDYDSNSKNVNKESFNTIKEIEKSSNIIGKKTVLRIITPIVEKKEVSVCIIY